MTTRLRQSKSSFVPWPRSRGPLSRWRTAVSTPRFRFRLAAHKRSDRMPLRSTRLARRPLVLPPSRVAHVGAVERNDRTCSKIAGERSRPRASGGAADDHNSIGGRPDTSDNGRAGAIEAAGDAPSRSGPARSAQPEHERWSITRFSKLRRETSHQPHRLGELGREWTRPPP